MAYKQLQGNRTVGSAAFAAGRPSAPVQLRVPRGRQSLHVAAVAEAEKTATTTSSSASAAPVAADISHKLRYQFGKTATPQSARDAYLGTAWSVREKLIDSFDKTHEYWQ